MRAAAQAKLVEGVALLKAADFAGALSKFQDAYHLVPSPNIHYDLGLAYVGLGRSAEALDAFERFLSDAPNAPADTRRKAKADAELMHHRVAALTISADVSGAEVLVDGRPRGLTPLARPLYLDPGPHEITGRGPGGAVGPMHVVADAGATVELSLHFPATVSPGPSGVISEGAGRVEPASAASPIPPEKPENKTTVIHRRGVWALSSAALGVAFLGAGLTFSLLARQEGDSLTHLSQQSTPANRPEFPPATESRGHSYQTLAWVSVGAGVVALAAGAILFVTGDRRASSGRLIGGSGVGGATLRLGF